MIEVRYSETFLKDLKALKSTARYGRIKTICFDELPNYSSILQIPNLEKIEGHKDFFRIRVGDYRIGIHHSHNSIVVRRVLHRKEVYRYFP